MNLEAKAEKTHAELLRAYEFVKSTAIALGYIYISAR
jgi:hypothetical protein